VTSGTSPTGTSPDRSTASAATAVVIDDGPPPMGSRLPTVVRVTSHVTVWCSVLAGLAVELSYGWRPVGDNAAIASRAYQSLTAHPPVLGLLSTASGHGHAVYDPGPLLFWLLAVPAHLDPTQGILWGAALLAGAVLSTAVEAVWSARLWAGCGVIAFMVVDMFWLTPAVFENISWNAYFPLPFLIASLALAWVVASGKLGWWPVLVFTASVAAQSHLLLALPAALLALTAPAAGVALGSRPARWRWIWAGIIVGLASWAAPIAQQLTGHPGNVSSMVSSQSGQTKLGLSFALSAFGRIGRPFPIWLTHQPTNILTLDSFETRAGMGAGIVLLVLVIVIVAWAASTRRRSLAAASAVALVASVAAVVSYAVVPSASAFDLLYLLNLLWPLGIAIWAVVAWAVVDAVLAWRVRRTGTATRPHAVTAAVGVVGVVLVTALVAGLVGVARFRPAEDTVSWDTADATSVAQVVRAVERVAPKGPVVVSVHDPAQPGLSTIWISEGVAWQLRADGWAPGLAGGEALYTGLSLPTGTRYTLVLVEVHGSTVSSVTATTCRTGIQRCEVAS